MNQTSNNSNFICLFLAVPWLCCSAGFSLVAADGLLSSCGVRASHCVDSPVVERQL